MIEIVEADLSTPSHAEAVVQLMDEYALDPMGGGKGLSDYVKANLSAELAKRKTAHVVLAFVNRKPAGLIVCLEGFSTFACKPLLNIHDVIVALPHRGRGLSKLLLQKAEAIAISLGCCKLTLEVLEGNHVAQSAYKAYGFRGYELDPQMGKALFWEKKLECLMQKSITW
jgi:GNAT superfamily N-acetyltransferase